MVSTAQANQGVLIYLIVWNTNNYSQTLFKNKIFFSYDFNCTFKHMAPCNNLTHRMNKYIRNLVRDLAKMAKSTKPANFDFQNVWISLI